MLVTMAILPVYLACAEGIPGEFKKMNLTRTLAHRTVSIHLSKGLVSLLLLPVCCLRERMYTFVLHRFFEASSSLVEILKTTVGCIYPLTFVN